MLPVYQVDGGKQIGGCTPVPLEYVRCGSGNRSVEGLVDFKKIIDSVLVVILAYERRIQFSRKRGVNALYRHRSGNLHFIRSESCIDQIVTEHLNIIVEEECPIIHKGSVYLNRCCFRKQDDGEDK